MKIFGMASLAVKTGWWKLAGNTAQIHTDYDAVCETYDTHYQENLGLASMELLKTIPGLKRQDLNVLELAAGTGEVTGKLLGLMGPGGHLVAVDRSKGMLDVNRRKNPAAEFVEADAIEYLASVPDHTVDYLVCAWGICYLPKKELRSHIARIMRPGGLVCLIENRAKTLSEVERIFTRVAMNNPGVFRKSIRIDLPTDARDIIRCAVGEEFEVLASKDGENEHRYEKMEDLVHYLLCSGISAGYLDAITPECRDQFYDEVGNEIDRIGPSNVPIVHRYSLVTVRASSSKGSGAAASSTSVGL